MKKTNLTRSLLAACSIVALSAVMYGCTSDGSENDLVATQDDLEQEKTARAAAEAKVAELEGDLTDANDDLAAANANVIQLTDDLATANDNVIQLTDDLADANDEVIRLMGVLETAEGDRDMYKMMLEEVNEKVADLETMLEDEKKKVLDLEKMLEDAIKKITDLEKERDKYRKMVEDGEKEVEDDERIARAKAIATAIGSNRVTGTRARNDGVGAGSMPVENRDGTTMGSQMPFNTNITATAADHGVAASRVADGAVKVTLTDRGTPAADLKFTGGEATADADNPWTMTMLTRRLGEDTARLTDDETEDVVVYTDIEAPTAKPITTEPAWLAAGHVEISTPNMNIGHVMPDVVPDPEGPTDVHGAGDTFDGTYRGVPGTYTCLGGDCNVDTDEDGEVTVALVGSATLQFEPDVLTATYNDPDTDYVYFGWWLNKPDDNTDAHMVETFAGGNNPAMAEATLEGTATYMGPAAGKYVTKSYTAGDLTDAQVGHFNATATLTANFDITAVGDLPGKSIDGSVTGFEQDGESLGTWKVSLNAAPINTNGSFTAMTDMNFGGATSLGAGNWQGQFYGPGATPADDHPSTAAGTFDAVVGDVGYVTGAFGAQKQ